jgi:hypothetical protein
MLSPVRLRFRRVGGLGRDRPAEWRVLILFMSRASRQSDPKRGNLLALPRVREE